MNRRVAPDNPDAGFTLSEVLISTLLFGTVCAIVTTAAVSGLRHQTQLQNRRDALAEARAALQRIDRDIRSASYPVRSVTPYQLVLQESQPTATRLMTYSVIGTKLYVDQTDTSSSGTITHFARKTLLGDLVDTTTTPVFSFAPYSGYAAPAGVSVNTSSCGLDSGSVDTGCVGTITVQLSFQPFALAKSVTVTDNGTELRNAP